MERLSSNYLIRYLKNLTDSSNLIAYEYQSRNSLTGFI